MQTLTVPFITKDQTVSSNAYISDAQMLLNAKYIYQYFHLVGWTDQAISGVFGSLEEESKMNPGIWQSLNEGNMSGGFGLVQWTPATNLINWANENGRDYRDIDTQLDRIEYERAEGLQYYKTDSYPLTFNQFIASTLDPEYLAIVWVANYERPKNPIQPDRQAKAREWYTLMTSEKWGDQVDGGSPPIGGDVWDRLLATTYNIKQLTEEEQSILQSLSIGDTVTIKYTSDRRKREVGYNGFNQRLTRYDTMYKIVNVSQQGYIVLSNNSFMGTFPQLFYQYLNPKYIRR